MTANEAQPSTMRAKLEERARALAVRPDAVQTSDEHQGIVDFMVFRRGSERFALPLADVVEISRHSRVRPLPGAAAPVVGLAGWRGRVLTVLDLNPAAGADSDHLVIAGPGRAAFAILADELEDARPLVADAAASASPHRLAWARGVTTDAITLIAFRLLQDSIA